MKEPEATSSSRQCELFSNSEIREISDTRYSRMSPDCSVSIMASVLQGASGSYSTSGVVLSDGRYSTHSTWDGVPLREDESDQCRNADAECLFARLSEILEKQPHGKYSLSPRACAGILRRAKKRKKLLPEILRKALEGVAKALTSTTDR